MEEIWKDIIGYEGKYQVSNIGRVKSLDRKRIGKFGTPVKLNGRILRQGIGTNGYFGLVFSIDGKLISKMVHRLVAQTFIPNPENKPQVNHIDGNKQNNYVDNLEWNTVSENGLHAFKNGLHIPHDCKGIKNGRARLTERQVLEIISLFPTKRDFELAAIYKIVPNAISKIRRNEAWKHLPR